MTQSQHAFDNIFKIVKHNICWTMMAIGTLPWKDFIFDGEFDDELIVEIREKRLAAALANELIENEPNWLNYDFEETQVKIDLADMVTEHLTIETIGLL